MPRNQLVSLPAVSIGEEQLTGKRQHVFSRSLAQQEGIFPADERAR